MSTAVQSISHSHFPLFGSSKRSHDEAFFKEPKHLWSPARREAPKPPVQSPKTEAAVAISSMKHEKEDLTLPPLREAIPEFQSHNPQEVVGEKPSPTSPGEGFVPQIQCETEGPRDSLPVSIPSPKRRRLSAKEPFRYQPFSPPESVHRPSPSRASNSAEPDFPRLHHLSPRARPLHRATMSSISMTDIPRSYAFHASRGSSSDIDSERPPLPALFVATSHPATSHPRYESSPVGSDTSFYNRSPLHRHGSPAPTSYPSSFRERVFGSPTIGSAGPSRHDLEYYDAGSGPKKRRGNLPKPVTELLRSWLHDHLDHPYPTEDEKQMLMSQTGLTISQISNWFINARRRRMPGINNSRQSIDNTKLGHVRRATSS